MFNSQLAALEPLRNQLDTLSQKIKQQLSQLTRFSDATGARMNNSPPFGGLSFNLVEALLYANQSIGLFRKLRIAKNVPVELSTWNSMVTAGNDIQNSIFAIGNLLDNVSKEARQLKIGAGGDLNLNDTGEPAYQFQGLAQALVGASNILLQCAIFIGVPMKLVGNNGDTAADEVVSDQITLTADALQSATSNSSEVATLAASSKASAGEIEKIKSALQSVLTDSQSAATAKLETLNAMSAQLTSLNEKATANSAVINSKLTDLTTIEAQAQDANSKIASYVANLTSTEGRVQKLQADAAALIEEFSTQRDSIAAMLTRADQMVSGATVVGLASTFAKERDELDKRLFWAFVWFLIGVLSLVGASSFLMLYLLNVHLPPIGEMVANAKSATKQDAGEPKYEVTLVGLLARTIILVGPLWFTQFSASRYRHLFDLRQNYSHKYNMAFSVEGFKKEAEKYREEIAFWVFTTISSNPAQATAKYARRMDDPPSLPLPETAEGGKTFIDNLLAVIRAPRG